MLRPGAAGCKGGPPWHGEVFRGAVEDNRCAQDCGFQTYNIHIAQEKGDRINLFPGVCHAVLKIFWPFFSGKTL